MGKKEREKKVLEENIMENNKKRKIYIYRERKIRKDEEEVDPGKVGREGGGEREGEEGREGGLRGGGYLKLENYWEMMFCIMKVG